MHPCPKKIQGITEITPPTDKQQLASFIGMVTYMGNFVPHLSHHTEPLRQCSSRRQSSHGMKWQMPASRRSRISLPRVPPSHSITMTEGNQSQNRWMPPKEDLLQDGQPIAYTSKSLTDTETRYANIERELLAIVFACQRFITYVLGRPFTVESDHKPLEMIHQKSLVSAPPRLQRMLLQLQRYDVTIRYRPGKEMLLADVLRRCPS